MADLLSLFGFHKSNKPIRTGKKPSFHNIPILHFFSLLKYQRDCPKDTKAAPEVLLFQSGLSKVTTWFSSTLQNAASINKRSRIICS